MSKELLHGVQPNEPDLEQAILGVLLLEKDRMVEVIQLLPCEDAFYKEEHKLIYKCMLDMHRNGNAIDMLTVMSELRNRNQIDTVGGNYYITEITMSVVSGAHLHEHCSKVSKAFLQRETIRLCGNMIKRSFEREDPHDIHDDFVHQFAKAFETKSRSAWIRADQAGRQFIEAREEIIANDGQTGISTTFEKLDKANGGFRPGQLIILAARPSVGKSALAASIALQTATNDGSVGIINLEMSIPETFGRLIAQESGIGYNLIERDIKLDNLLLGRYVDRLSKLPIYFSQSTKVNIHDITNAATYLHQKHGLKLLIVDYLQLVEEDAKSQGNRERAISKISRGLKTLAMALKIPVIALSQLNRESDKRQDKKPVISDLRESGAIEQDADVIMMLHRDWRVDILQDAQGNSTEFQADLLIPKWRNGSTLRMKLKFDPPTMRFSVPEDNPFTDENEPF